MSSMPRSNVSVLSIQIGSVLKSKVTIFSTSSGYILLAIVCPAYKTGSIRISSSSTPCLKLKSQNGTGATMFVTAAWAFVEIVVSE